MILTHLNMMLFAQLDKQLAHEFLRDVFSIKFYVDVNGKKNNFLQKMAGKIVLL